MKHLVVAEVVKTFVYGDDRNTGMTETLDEFRYLSNRIASPWQTTTLQTRISSLSVVDSFLLFPKDENSISSSTGKYKCVQFRIYRFLSAFVVVPFLSADRTPDLRT